MTRKQAISGFTLIELMMVIAIIMSLGITTTAYMARFLLQNAVESATDQLVGDFRKAQVNAMMGKQNSNWGVNYSNNTITLYRGTVLGTPDHALDETFSVNPNVTISGFTDINFSRMTGVPNSTATITVSNTNGETKTVTINAQGMVTR